MHTTLTHANTEPETPESNTDTSETRANPSALQTDDTTGARADALEANAIDTDSGTTKPEGWTPTRTATDGVPATFCSHSNTRLQNLIDEYNAAVDTHSDETA